MLPDCGISCLSLLIFFSFLYKNICCGYSSDMSEVSKTYVSLRKKEKNIYQGPVTVVQSIVSLTSFLVVKMLMVLLSTRSNLRVFLLKKCE